MFSQKRRFYEKKSFYLALVVALLAAGSFSLWMGGDFGDEEAASGLSPQTRAEALPQGGAEDGQPSASAGAFDAPVYDNQPVSAAQDSRMPDTAAAEEDRGQPASSPGYLVVEEDGYIRIYQIDALGGMKVLRTSDISFDLLGQEDQLMFRQGIRLETEDQLMELLQDFES